MLNVGKAYDPKKYGYSCSETMPVKADKKRTSYLTAPFELALTLAHLADGTSIMTAAAAHDVTSVHAHRRHVASTARRTD